LEKEIEKWFDSMDDELQEAFLELKDVDDDTIQMTIGEEETDFSITYPKDYPNNKEDRFFIFSENSDLTEWSQHLNEFADKSKTKIGDLLTEAAERFVKIKGGGKSETGFEDDEEEANKPKPPKKPKEPEIDKNEFLPIGSPTATLRLLNDLKNIKKQKVSDLGFTAHPVPDKKSGMENLYHWHIKLFGIDKQSDLYKDVQVFQKQTGQDHILIEMRFSKDYPHIPPFVRVVKPRFQFRTGHVTIGGSICMELLTNSGWNATNDIESILVQITAELVSGGARLDKGSGNYEYSEHEAWEAFYRAAGTHGWDVKGLSKEMFPKPE
jgi:ubiquitin-conjugating enzyme E2 Q